MDTSPNKATKEFTSVVYINQAQIVQSYYNGVVQISVDSISPPSSAFIKTLSIDEKMKTSRKRKRKKYVDELVRNGKFVPIAEDIKELLKEAHKQICLDGKYHLQPLIPDISHGESVSNANTFIIKIDNNYNQSSKLNTNSSNYVQVVHSNSSESWILPPRCSFALCDVRYLQKIDNLGKFKLIVMDPPWYNKSVTRSGMYNTFHHTELMKINIHDLCHPDECVLAIWVTNKPEYTTFLVDTLLPHWGFQLYSVAYWLKISCDGDFVTPLDSNHRLPFEKLIISYRSDTNLLEVRKRLDKIPHVFVSIPLRHSWKPPPECYFSPSLFPKESCRLELFARELRKDWCSIGLEVLKFQNAKNFDLIQV